MLPPKITLLPKHHILTSPVMHETGRSIGWGQREAARKINHHGANTKVHLRQIKSRRLKSPALCCIKPNVKKQVFLTKKRAAALHPFQSPPELQRRSGCSPGSGMYQRVSLTIPALAEKKPLNLTNCTNEDNGGTNKLQSDSFSFLRFS